MSERLQKRRSSNANSGITLKVRLTPKSSRDEIVGVEEFGGEAVLRARVRALPEAGRANAALTKLIASWLKLPASAVAVAHGAKSRLKHVEIEGDAERLALLVETRLAALTG